MEAGREAEREARREAGSEGREGGRKGEGGREGGRERERREARGPYTMISASAMHVTHRSITVVVSIDSLDVIGNA